VTISPSPFVCELPSYPAVIFKRAGRPVHLPSLASLLSLHELSSTHSLHRIFQMAEFYREGMHEPQT
jgi:hypothetical protein